MWVLMRATTLPTSTHHSSEGSRLCCTAGVRFLRNPSAAGLPSSGIPAGRPGGLGSAGSSSSCRRQWASRGTGTPQPEPEAAALLPLPPAEPWPRVRAQGAPLCCRAAGKAAPTLQRPSLESWECCQVCQGREPGQGLLQTMPMALSGQLLDGRKQPFNELQRIRTVIVVVL